MTGIGILVIGIGSMCTLVTDGSADQNYVAHTYGVAFIAIGLCLAVMPFVRSRPAMAAVCGLALIFAVCGTEATIAAGNLYSEIHGSEMRFTTPSELIGFGR